MGELVRCVTRLVKLGFAIFSARCEGTRLQSPAERAVWQRRQARRMLAALDVEVRVAGELPSGGMIVCNHLGFLDILVIAAQGSVVFVAKSDVRKWPAIGGLLECAGTILAERERPLSAGKTSEEIRQVLAAGIPVVLFPEGTSSDGASVLPFKPTLLQVALDTNAAITPAAISYQAVGGNAANDVCYWGEATFFPHLIKLARLSKITAELNFGKAAPWSANRKEAAAELRAEVSRLKSTAETQVPQKV